FYAIDPEFELVYKLASLAHLSVKSNGSFGDIAASTYGGWIAYACFDREWVMEKATELTLTELLKTEWPQLMIRPLTPPANLRLVIGWTGSPASTTHLVDRINDVRGGIDDFYKTFLGASKTCVNAMIAAFEKGDLQAIQAGIRENRLLLQQLTAHTGVVIETPPLTQLCDLAEKNLGAAKSSGAGGGDCGIVIIDRQSGIIPLISEWEKVGIMNLPLHVFKYVRAAAPIEWKGASE
ncbi:MAG TPA: phosphomevalonate kinase, partial [Trichococcus flocculiformis]|nr:phosphomevalonate kinase [Trichococcus flocculiformis]